MKLLLLPVISLLFSIAATGQQTGTPISCEEARTIAAEIAQFSGTAVFQRTRRAAQDSLRILAIGEVSAAFGRDSAGLTIASSLTSGGKSSVRIPPVPHTFADLHTHPNNTPPSSGDVYGLLQNCSKAPGYTMRFVLLRNGNLYVLFVQDTAAAAAFLQKYPPQRMTGYSPLFPETLLDEFREIKYRYGAAEELAMAFILEKYNAGVLLFKQANGEGLTWVRGSVRGVAPRLVFTTEACW